LICLAKSELKTKQDNGPPFSLAHFKKPSSRSHCSKTTSAKALLVRELAFAAFASASAIESLIFTDSVKVRGSGGGGKAGFFIAIALYKGIPIGIYSMCYHFLQKEAPLAKGLTTKSAIFGVPSLETARAIDDSDKVAAAQAAHYRLERRMAELEAQFEAKASELRAAFVAELTAICGGGE